MPYSKMAKRHVFCIGAQMALNKVIRGQSPTRDIKRLTNDQRYFQKSSVHNKLHKETRIPKCANLDEVLMQHCLNLVEAGASESLSIIYRSATSVTESGNFGSSDTDVKLGSFQPRMRKRMADLNNFPFECTCTICSRSEITKLVQWIFNTIEGKEKVRNLLKSQLVRRLGDMDGKARLSRMKSVSERERTEFITFLSDMSVYSPGKSVVENSPIGKQRHVSNITDKMLAPCSSTNSTSSFESTFASDTTFKGLIHFTWKRGTPHFVLSLNDREVYIANPYSVESSDDKTLDYIYVFHSGMDYWKEQVVGNNMTGVVGKMKVSSSLTLSSTSQKFRETEFVLFDASENLVQTQSSIPRRKNRTLSRTMIDMFRTNSFRQKFTTEFGHQRFISSDFSQEKQEETFQMLNQFHKDALISNNCSPDVELAAIVIKDHYHDNSEEEIFGGWGLNFLKRAEVQHTDRSTQISSGNYECCYQRKENNDLMNMNVIVPAGLHGGPRTQSGGPSSLTERWRSGGRCDCGGWDIGCPLTVFSATSRKGEALPEMDTQADCRSFDLFIEVFALAFGNKIVVPRPGYERSSVKGCKESIPVDGDN
ncbi:hypothetical protein ACLOJK_011248 [Asimina triloba]